MEIIFLSGVSTLALLIVQLYEYVMEMPHGSMALRDESSRALARAIVAGSPLSDLSARLERAA